MLNEKQILEIREHLNSSVSPLFYFDNDQDGLCSYLLLRRMIGRGNGVPVKTSPLDMSYYRRVREFEPDCVFVLDQPTVDNEFFEELEKDGIKVVWIDHHECDVEKISTNVYYYNPLYNESADGVPVTAQCYQVANRKEDIWLAVIGCVADKYMPSFYPEFLKLYPDLGFETDDAFGVLYNSEIGKIARMVGSGLKDRTTNVISMLRYFYSVKSPYEVLDETRDNHVIHKRFVKIDEKFKKYISKAKENVDESNVLVFKYSGETSMSADIANKLSFLYSDKYIVVAFIKGVRVNLSMRGRGIRSFAQEAISGFSHATCGGHEDAVGAQLDEGQLEDFVDNLKNLL